MNPKDNLGCYQMGGVFRQFRRPVFRKYSTTRSWGKLNFSPHGTILAAMCMKACPLMRPQKKPALPVIKRVEIKSEARLSRESNFGSTVPMSEYEGMVRRTLGVSSGKQRLDLREWRPKYVSGRFNNPEG